MIHIERVGKGPKIVFIHGSGWNTKVWKNQKEYLKDLFEVILVDLPGHGNSKGEAPRSVEEYSEVLDKVLLENLIDKSYICGHSLGGAIAMYLALKRDELIKGLIVIGSGARLKVLPEILNGVLPEKEKTIRFVNSLAFSSKAEKELIEKSVSQMMECPSYVLFNDFSACHNFDVMDKVKYIKVPTLIVCGVDDMLTPVKYSQYLHREIKNSKLVLIEGAGHMVMMEKPMELNVAIESFVKDLEKGFRG
ncbi:MAG: alpha/beta hydrolase [Deltaproteobacteria bacterium]|nr:alpha/beta hydrolase [Deltaproteobacteria bacterium]